jgi:hypothetical protein
MTNASHDVQTRKIILLSEQLSHASIINSSRYVRPRIPSCFHNRIRAKELKRCLNSQSQVFSGLDESKADKLTLEPILGYFHDLDVSQKVLTLS